MSTLQGFESTDWVYDGKGNEWVFYYSFIIIICAISIGDIIVCNVDYEFSPHVSIVATKERNDAISSGGFQMENCFTQNGFILEYFINYLKIFLLVFTVTSAGFCSDRIL